MEITSFSSCQTCSLAPQCMPQELTPVQVAKLENIVGRSITYKKGVDIYRQDDQFEALYVVRSGATKSYKLSPQGEERITGFYLPGEVFGSDGIASGRYHSFSSALGTASVCKVDFLQLQQLSIEFPRLQQYLYRLMSGEIIKEQNVANWLGSFTAMQRISALIISLYDYLQRLNKLEQEIYLPMTKAACASYLGLTAESFSRVLSQMQEQGYISVSGRLVEISDMEELRSLIG